MKKIIISAILLSLVRSGWTSDIENLKTNSEITPISAEVINQAKGNLQIPDVPQPPGNERLGSLNLNHADVQIYKSAAKYGFQSTASEAMQQAINNLNAAEKTRVLEHRIIQDWQDYYFEITFYSPMQLQIYRSKEKFLFPSTAESALDKRAQELKALNLHIVSPEVVEADVNHNYTYAIAYFLKNG